MKASIIVPAIIFCVLTVGIGSTGYGFFEYLKKAQKTLVIEQLSSIGKLKAGQISAFLQQHEGNATLIARFLNTRPMQGWLTNQKAELPTVLKQSLDKEAAYNYHGLLILDSHKAIRYTSGNLTHLTPEGYAMAAKAMEQRTTVLSEFYFGDPIAPDLPIMDVFAPIMIDDQPEPSGVLVLRAKLDALYQLIQSWPIDSATGESLIARRDGNDVLFLNELRFKKNTALKLRVPLSLQPDSPAWPAIRAVNGQFGAFESYDYRNERVIAYTLPISGTQWGMIVKVSYDEVLQSLQRLQMVTTLITALFIIFAWLAFILWWRKQQAVQNIIERKKTEQRIAAVIDSAPDAMVITDASGTITLLNQQAERMFGYARSELIGQLIECLLPPRFRAKHPAQRMQYNQAPQSRLMDAGRVVSVQRKDGSEFSAEVSLSPIQTDEGMLVVSALRDVTERYRMEVTLRNTETQLRNMFESAAIGMTLMTIDGHFLKANPSLCHILGYTLEEIVQLSLQNITYPDDMEAELVLLHQLETRQISNYQLEKRYVHKDGHIIWVQLNRSSVIGDDGATLLYYIGELQDISARKKAEENLRFAYESMAEAEKMAALGGLVAGVAHEINTPIGVNLASATHLEGDTRRVKALYAAGELSEDELEDYFATADQAVKLMIINSQRAADLIQSFKQVAVDQTGGEQREFDLRVYIEEVLLSLRPKFKHSPITVVIDCAPGIQVNSLPGALSQILTNLILNALTHGFDNKQSGEITIQAILMPDDTIKLCVIDDGNGIPEDIQARIFEPFFTTRRGRGGSGLGLNIAYNVAHHGLNGSLRVQSAAGQGTTFTLTFPRALSRTNPRSEAT
ncbi:MAG: PAS domain S-box protein [Methylococcaceae bacterium]|nr:MAG: PAS domain S-box protein [Methylococcaceae bacterium]